MGGWGDNLLLQTFFSSQVLQGRQPKLLIIIIMELIINIGKNRHTLTNF